MRYDANAREIGSGAFALFMGALLLGELMGSLSVILSSGQAAVLYETGEPLRSALMSFLGTSIYMCAVFLAGFFPIGQPLALAVMLVRGLGEGAFLTKAYACSGLEGAAQTGLMYIPQTAVTAAALSLGCIEAVTLSSAYLRHTLSDRQVLGMKDTVRLYIRRFIRLEVLCLFGAGIRLLTECIMR